MSCISGELIYVFSKQGKPKAAYLNYSARIKLVSQVKQLAVLKSIIFSPLVDVHQVSGAPTCMRQDYDSPAFRISPGGYSSIISQDVCQQLCSDQKFPFVGLLFGEYCLCSNSTAGLEEVDSSLCDKYCSGNEEEICGSNDLDIIYVMEADIMGSVDSIAINIGKEIFTDKPAKISLTIGASTAYFAIIDFGDGTAHKFTSEPYEIEKYYRIPGEYVVHASAVDIAELNPAIFAELTIIVEDQNLNFDVSCPVVVEPKIESQCNATFYQGSYTNMTFQMAENSDESQDLPVPEPFYLSIGFPTPPAANEEEYIAISEKEIYLSYSSTQFKSYLLGFEFLVKEIGTITLMVLTPCSDEKYCEETFGCSAACSDYNVRTCDNKALCSYIGQCVDPESLPDCSLKSASDFSYEVKYAFEVNVDSVGYQYYDVPEKQKHEILPGDIIGFKTDGSSALWCKNASDSDAEDRSSDGNLLGVNHFLRAFLTEAVNISLKYIYDETGNQSVLVSGSNKWLEEPVKKIVYLPVQIPISGVSIELSAINNKVGESVIVTINIVNGSDVTLVWDYYNSIVKEESFEGGVPDEGYNLEISCESSGDIVVKVNVSNLWSSEVVSKDFQCFSSISRNWTLSSDSPKSVPPGKINFNLKYDGSSLPSSAVYVIDFGDGSEVKQGEIQSDSDSWEDSIDHEYETEGNFSVVVNISNPVDFEVFETTVQIVEKMGILTVTPYYVTSNGTYPDSKKELGGFLKNFAPKDCTVYFEYSITGDVTKYIMSSIFPDLNKESSESVISHEFPDLGVYVITFKAYNSELDEYSNEVLLILTIMDGTLDATFTASQTSVETEETVEFLISLSTFDPLMCVIFKSGDNSKPLVFGNTLVCALFYDISFLGIPEIPPIPTFRKRREATETEWKNTTTVRKRREVTKTEWKNATTISILYEYSYGGSFIAELDAFGFLSRVTKTLFMEVNDGDFLAPLLWIDENSTDISKPLKRQRGYDFRIETTAIFRNNESYLASHLWTAAKIDGDTEEEIDISELKTYNCSALRVTRRFLDIGLYKFSYTLTIYDEMEAQKENEEKVKSEDEGEYYEDYYSKKLNNEDDDEEDDSQISYENMTILAQRTVFTYIEIIPTPLIPTLIHGGASYVVRGLQQTVHLEPLVYTIDPDNPDEGGLEVTWFCARNSSGESLTKLDEFKYDTSNPSAPITDRSTIKEDDDKGGCFGKGPGLIEIGSGDYKMECNTLWGFDNIYEITAVLNKGTKVAETRLLVEVIEKSPPSLRVMCEKRVACYPKIQGQFINPNSFIPLKTECLEDCGEEGELTLEWHVYASDLKTFARDPIENWEQHTLVDGDRMGLNQTLFISNPDIKIYLVEVTGKLENPQVPIGVSSIFLIINNPPDNGDCKISTTSGMALLDVFLIEFTNWDDKDGHFIADYSIYVKYGDESMRLSYGLKTKVEVVLPYGDLQIWCSIQDNIGGTTMYSAANFSTSLPTEEELDEYEEMRFFDKCLAEGKMSMASQIVIAKNSIILEYKRRRNQTGDFVTKITLTQHTGSLNIQPTYKMSFGHRPRFLDVVWMHSGNAVVSEAEVDKRWSEFLELDGIDSSYYSAQARDEIREMLTEQLEIQQDKDAKAKNKEINKLLRLPMEALPDAEIFGGALSAVADNGPSDMSAKLKLMTGMKSMFEILNDTEVPHPEDLKIVINQFGGLADSIAGSLADSNIGGHFLPGELKEARLELDHNSTEPNFFIFYIEGNRQEVQDKLYGRTVDAAKNSQENNAKDMVNKMKDMISSIQQNCIQDLMVGPDPFITESKSGFQMTLLKNYASNLSGNAIHQGGSSITLPDLCAALGDECDSENAAFGVQSVRWTQPLESYGSGSESLSEDSSVIQIDITSHNGSDTIRVTNSSEPFIICIPHSSGGSSESKMEHVVPKFTRTGDILVYHTTLIESEGVVATVDIAPENTTAPLVLLFKYGGQLSLVDYDEVLRIQDIPSENGVHTLVIGSEYITEPNKNLSVAIGHFSSVTNMDKYFKNPKKYNLTVANMTNEFTSNYSIAISAAGCYYFSEEEEKWSTAGCKVSGIESGVTCCECNHLTSFASGLIIAPNEINFNYVFANADFNNNKAIYATLIVMFSVFLILLIFARWKDRKDIQKLGATPLPDNDASDKYIYEILVFTGHQRNAGTKSNVFFIVSGEEDETEVRNLSDDKRPILRPGSVDVFVMAVPQSLGQLNYLRIWHDNSGTGKWSSWYCQYIVFRDVQTGLKYEFLVNRWFAVEDDDGLIDRLIPVAGREQVTEFSHLFSTNSRRNLADRHLWFSVFLRPPRSRFTRVQRVSCCMAVLCLSMLTNAMYYQRTPAKPSSGGFKFGPLSLSPEQIAVGIVTNLLIFPPTFIMIFFFRKSRPKKLRPSHVDEALKKQREEFKKNNPERRLSKPRTMTEEEAQMHQRKKKFSLPWWCVYFGWLFVILSIGSSLFFVWAYGIEFGDEKTSKWLTSLVIAFFSSVLITQPIKVVLMAIIVSCMCRSMDYDEDDADEDEENPTLQNDEVYLHDRKKSKKITYRPMDLEALEEARKEREKEVKMYSVIKEVAAYFFFLWVIMILSYGNRDPNNFYLREALINGFIKPGDLWVDYNFVNTEKRFWNWTHNALLPELFALQWYNGRDPLGLRLFLDDRNNLKISYAVLRQVRIKPRSCKVSWLLETVTPECAGFGNVVFEDGTLYTKGWRLVNSSDTLVPPEYKYLSASQLKGYPFWGQMDWYGGGGYVVALVSRRDSEIEELKKKVKRLEVDGWIDRHTRAVFAEFGIYNAQINLFCAVTILAEFVPGGGVVPYYHVDPVRLLNYHTGFGLFQMIIEIIFVLFTIFFTYKEVTKICREGFAYFKEFWNMAELVSIIVSYTGIANQIYKLFMTAEILRIFTETEGTGYVKLQEAVLLNDLLCYQIGLVMSISTLKFLKLLRFNKRIGVLSSTLRVCAHELKSYAVCLMVVFVAFVILFWLLLGRFVREFSTFVYSFESSISMMLKKFNYEDMYQAQPIFTPIAFFTFSLATAVVLINILLSIIIRSFEDVKRDVSLQSNEYEILDFFINRMKMTLGCGTGKVRPQPSMYREEKKPKDTVSSFPDKVDKLLDFINNFYFENQMDFNSKDFLKKMNADIARANGVVDREKKKAKPVKAKRSKIPKTVSDRFDDF